MRHNGKTTASVMHLGVVGALLTAAAVGAPVAAETPLHRTVTVDYRNVPLLDALKDLGLKAGVQFVCDAALAQGLDPVVYAGRDQEAGRVATRILRPRGLQLETTRGNLVTVTRLDPLDEFKVKREPAFEFVETPRVTRQGDRVTISFTTGGFCDATVAIEDASGKIIRHLASGVLGENAPEPFLWNTKRQVLVWDGKDDLGIYVDDKEQCVVRVSLGLKAAFERSLLWSPHRRAGRNAPSVCAQPEGVYVFEGSGFDHLRLFDHEGQYVRTLYPFPADKVDKVEGLKRHTFPQTGAALPLKGGFYESTLLTSGYTAIRGNYAIPADGTGSTAMAVGKGRIALPCLTLNRLGTDGSSGGLPFEGPKTSVSVMIRRKGAADVPPRSAALSPDGKTLYLTGFIWHNNITLSSGGWIVDSEWIHGVGRMDLTSDRPPEVFVGSLEQGQEFAGSDEARFDSPTSVGCDPQGRVYVADHFNNRVQVFAPDGKHLKTIAVNRPSDVAVDQKTGDLYVFSWVYPGRSYHRGDRVPAVLTHFGPLDDPRQIAAYPLPMQEYAGRVADPRGSLQYRGAVDSWRRGESGPTIWFAPGSTSYGYHRPTRDGSQGSLGREAADRRSARGSLERCGILLLQEKDNELLEAEDFGRLARRETPAPAPPDNWRQRLYVRPTTGHLYVSQGMSFGHLIRIDPETARHQFVDLPFSAEDLAFDLRGLAYLRTLTDVVRYDPDTWREVPFDYGQERPGAGFRGDGRGSPPIVSAITWPSQTLHHQGGIWVSPQGKIAVACLTTSQAGGRKEAGAPAGAVKPWTPRLFPGRGGNTVVHVWDEHGRLAYEDAIPGLGFVDGVALDKDDNLYLMSACTRVLGGQRYFDYMTGSLLKVRAGAGKILCGGGEIPIPLPLRPARPPDLTDGSVGGNAWVAADWFYGGLGFTGKDGSHAMGGCNCWNYRFTLDGFARSFAPETQHYSVAVLDSSGNLILRIGRYGNVDDGRPLAEGVRGQGSGVRDPESASFPLTPDTRHLTPGTRSIGGDEMAFFYPAYVGVASDRRLFVADSGNDRIVGLALAYHAEAKVALKVVPDAAGK